MSAVIEEIGSPEAELTMWALREFLNAYEPGEEDPKTRRKRCSRQDYWCGYRAALIELKAWSHFKVPPR